MPKLKNASVNVSADTSGLDVAIEKAKQLKSLLQEVKELSASLDVAVTINGKKF